MTAKRVFAFLAAAALIVAAFLIRNGLDDSSSSTSNPSDNPSSGKIVVICSTEFASACGQLGNDYTVMIESAGTTLDDLALAGATMPDAWVTLDPFPGMLDATRTFANLNAVTTGIVAVATDTPVLAVPKARSAAITGGCSGAVWKCVGTFAGQSWTALAGDAGAGDVIPGIESPDSAAAGLLTFATAVSGYFDSTNLDPSSWTDTNFGKWMRNFSSHVKVVDTGTTPLGRLLVRQTEVNVAATSASEIAASTRQGDFATVAVAPAVPLVAVVASFSARASGVASVIASSLHGAAWVAATDPNPQLTAGTFIALRKLWKDYNK